MVSIHITACVIIKPEFDKDIAIIVILPSELRGFAPSRETGILLKAAKGAKKLIILHLYFIANSASDMLRNCIPSTRLMSAGTSVQQKTR